MSEQNNTPDPVEPETPEQQPQEGGEGKTFDEAYVKKLRDEAAKHRLDAKANADAAAELAQIKDAQKSEAEKVADRIAKAEAEVAAVPTKVADALRTHLVALHKISDEDAELFLTAGDPEVLLKQVDRLVARNTEAEQAGRLRGNHVPNEGANRAQTFDNPRAADLAQIEADIRAGNRRS